MAQLNVTLKKSVIGEQWRARRVVTGLGLTKVNQTRTLPDNDSIRGMIRKVKHLVAAEPVPETPQASVAPTSAATAPAEAESTETTESTE
jgi:large subunit ribosomal protein L30